MAGHRAGRPVWMTGSLLCVLRHELNFSHYVRLAIQADRHRVNDMAGPQQTSNLSKAPVADAEMRLANAKTLSATPQQASLDDVAQLRQASVGVAAMSLAGDPVNAPYSDTIARGHQGS